MFVMISAVRDKIIGYLLDENKRLRLLIGSVPTYYDFANSHLFDCRPLNDKRNEKKFAEVLSRIH